MGDWDLRLVDFWDQQAHAINDATMRLIKLGPPERTAACGEIRQAVLNGVAALDDSRLLRAAVSMVDDLYKYVNDAVLMDPSLFAYLDAFGRTFTTAVRERGYVIRYVVDNQFSDVEFMMLGPFDLFQKIFNAAGFVYISPQQMAWRLMQGDGVADSAYEASLPQYIAEARMLADRLANRCLDEGRHYVFLEADYEDGSLNAALGRKDAPGVLTVFRNDVPLPGTNVSAGFPEQKREDAPVQPTV